MNETKEIRVLIVDDSLLFREILSKGVMTDPMIRVVGVASDPFEARDKIIEHKPDVVTCDIEMPKMNGIEFVQRVLPQYFVPFIIVSSASSSVFDAIQAGAIDFLVKPPPDRNRIDLFIQELILKIKSAAQVNPVTIKSQRFESLKTQRLFPTQSYESSTYDLIALGASTGGTEAILRVLEHLPNTIPGMVIVQHIPPVFSHMFAERLNEKTKLKVKEAKPGDLIERGSVYIAPGDHHIRVKKSKHSYFVECFSGEKINGHCPSVDVLFHSVAEQAGSRAIGILLTGMGHDGAKGLMALRNKGARTIGQDEPSSVVYGMPKEAFDIGAVEKQVSLSKIPEALLSLLR